MKFTPLAPTSYGEIESATPGEGVSGVEGGVPSKYVLTSRGYTSLCSWNSPTQIYSMLQIYLGYEALSKIEIISLLNIKTQARDMYAHDHSSRTSKYDPKVYLGTTQTMARYWNIDTHSGKKFPSTWPEKKPQKGEIYID